MKFSCAAVSIVLFFFACLTSCANSRLDQYEKQVQEADGFEIYLKRTNRTVRIAPQEMNSFKSLLTGSIQPAATRNIADDVRIDFYKKGELKAFILTDLSSAGPYGNFNSQELSFGFKLSHGLGSYLDQQAAMK